MIPRAFPTTAAWLSSLLRRWVSKGYATNVLLAEGNSTRPPGVEDGEMAVALVKTADGREFTLTSGRVIEQGRTVLRYDEVIRCHWITDHPDPWEHARLKRTHSHRLILDLADGRKVTLEQLGQAVYPLLRFFGSIVRDVPTAPDDAQEIRQG